MNTISFSLIDTIILSAYLITTFYLGFIKSPQKQNTAAEYIIAGRRVTLPAFVASLVSTWYGGILGVGEFTYKFGISNWLVFGVPYYLYALIFAQFIAKRARRTAFVTIPDQLQARYGRRASLAGAGFIFLLSLPAPYVLMLGSLITLFFPIPLWLAILIGSTYSFAYIVHNGFSAVVRTDILQFGLMFGGFILILSYAMANHGGFAFLAAELPQGHLTWHGGNSLPYILVWYVIAASTLVDPNFYQRCYAARSESTARNGILISILFWIVFDFLTTTTGLYARVLLPELANPVEAYPLLAEFLLPQIAKGIFFVALFATVMSTLDSFAFVSGLTLGRDVMWKLRNRIDESTQQAHIKLGLVITFVVSIFIAILSRSVIDIWYQLGSVATPALAIPLAASFSERWKMQPDMAFFSILISGGGSLFWLMIGISRGQNFLGLEPIYLGLVVSIVLFMVGILLKNK
ncbi:MAG: sodium:solute symporter [bacterium]